MKLKYFTSVLLCVFAIGLVSCGDDEPSSKNPLKGTKWVCDNSYAAYIMSGIKGETYVEVFEFVSDTQDKHYFQSAKNGNRESEIEGRYEYVNDQYFYLFSEDGTKNTWYFLSSTEFCNKKDKTESWASVFKKL